MPQNGSNEAPEEWVINVNILGPNTLEAKNIMFGIADGVQAAPAPTPANPSTPLLQRRRPGRPSRRELELRNTPPINDLQQLQQQVRQQMQQQMQQQMPQQMPQQILHQMPHPRQDPPQLPISGLPCGLCKSLTADTIISSCGHSVCGNCVPRLLSICPTCQRTFFPGNLIRTRP
ncbi:V(D)J recombination-activating protein 1 [Frankliniella fusca]|uniref:V(D)J recombination-activating protein 1 n=1 Tax=Frankliniella fusca TaxID=407009 RepID=A0AAE1HKE2_9NEOP|nr:V(D)J recombination-activating protein 1 [Frankliniella fusca]